jgi:hypothetical protein
LQGYRKRNSPGVDDTTARDANNAISSTIIGDTQQNHNDTVAMVRIHIKAVVSK